MTGTRYPDMVCLSMLDEPVREEGPVGHDERPTLHQERPVVLIEYSDNEIGAMVRMACGLDRTDGRSSTAAEIGEELDMDEPMKIGRFLDMVRTRLSVREHGNHGRPRSQLIGRPSAMSAEQKARALELHHGGMTVQEVADAVGATLGQARYVLTGT